MICLCEIFIKSHKILKRLNVSFSFSYTQPHTKFIVQIYFIFKKKFILISFYPKQNSSTNPKKISQKILADYCRHIHIVYSLIDNCLDTQHHTVLSTKRSQSQWCCGGRQSRPSDGRGRVHNVVHARIYTAL